MKRHIQPLETLILDQLPDEAVPAYEAALQAVSATVALFRDEATDTWRIEAVREATADQDALSAALALAAGLTGHDATLARNPTEAEGWLARTVEAFPEQPIATRFLVRPSHAEQRRVWGRHVLTLDAGLAFGSGEHSSTRGCLTALEALRLPPNARVLDLGAGSGILAMGAAKLAHVRVLASDLDPWSVRVAEENAVANGLRGRIRAVLALGWNHREIHARAPYDLVFANILARPLCAMAKDLAQHLAPGGRAILAGLLDSQVQMVLAAHRRQGLVLERRISLSPWATLVLRRRG
ncbi:50S ribosomal protein L11 methyltransferase [Roseococcus suduntuyensis]|uniref:Ribosomal protein L11 methyltransferase n=1 Tax=Roseococcus suduntuyensis TaxID=455361 RepID=A0A840AE38_9PROT|nr:50S ribosomal protein L11 methyltransferase [Roseococcus suduntuyensis]MBB3898345.1 ribosomal protein L11 methyltransferase [Roseococcus suduntuyensis]